MADDVLQVGSEFDPTGLLRGLGAGEAALNDFQKVVQRTAAALPGLDKAQFMKGVTQGAREAAAELKALESQTVRVTDSTKNAHRATNLLRGGLSQLAVQASGASGALGQITQSLAFMVGGSTAAIGFAAAIGVLALAYDKLTKSAREAAKAQQEHIAALQKAIAADQDALAADLAVATKRAADLRRQIADAKAQQGQPGFAGSTFFAAEITKMERELATLDIVVGQGNDLFLAGEKAKAAALKVTTGVIRDQTRALREAHDARVKAAGGGNLPAGSGGTAAGPLSGGALIHGATSDDIGLHAMALNTARAAAAAALAKQQYDSFLSSAHGGFVLLAGDAAKAAKQALDVSNAFGEIGQALHGLSAVRQALGLIGDEAGAAIEASAQLADALSEVALSASTGNILGAIVAGASLIGQLFTESPREREHAQLIDENNRRLAELRVGLDRTNFGAEGLAKAKDILGTKNVLRLDPVQGFELTADFQQALDRAGLTLEQFAIVVEQQTGLKILDSEGRLIASEFVKARESIAEFEQAAKDAANSVAGLQQSLDLHARIQGPTAAGFGTAQGDLERNRAALLGGLQLDPSASDQIASQLFHGVDLGGEWEKQIASLDLSTEAGREAYRVFLFQLEQMGKEGKLTAEELAAVGAGADALNQATADAANAITDAARQEADARNRAVGDAVDAARRRNEAEEQARKAAEDLAKALADAAATERDHARQEGDLLDRIVGKSGAEQAVSHFQRELAILGASIPGLKDAFKGLDLNDPATKDALRQQLLKMFDQIGSVDPALRDEFVNLLGSGADILDGFNESVQDATKSLTNVPHALNLQALEFRAQAGGRPLSSPRPGDGASLPVGGTIHYGDVEIYVTTQAGQSPAEIAQAVKRELQRKSNATYGTPDRYGRL